MQKPLIEGIEVLSSLGGGVNGRVYRARDASGADVVLKVFHEPAVCRDLLKDSARRLEEDGWPEGVLPVLAADYDEIPSFHLTPALVDEGEDGVLVPRSLQHQFIERSGTHAGDVIRGVASALAAMHRCGVSHGNLKPCNVMFGENGGVFLTDWMLGNMPGVRELHFTDALLYQAPEQLTHSTEMQEAGARWDVFAFGVLAFRLLTGRFPRCHDTYLKVAPASGHVDGETRLVVDLDKVAANLWREPEPDWPEEADAVDPRMREILGMCLRLDWRERPGSMVEVERLLGEKEAAVPEVMPLPLPQRRKRDFVVFWRIGFAAACMTAVFLGVAANRNAVKWRQAEGAVERQSEEERNARRIWLSEKRELVDAYEKAVIARTMAQGEVEKMRVDLQYERDLGRARLEASREIGDQLFAWAMEKGHRRLPPLDGRELRLKRLERYYVDFLERTSGMPELADEMARARLQLAEISLAMGDEKTSTTRLDEVLQAFSDKPMDEHMRMRIATNHLLLAILKQAHAAEDVEGAFARARKSLEEVPRTGVDETRLDQMLAVLDFHEARFLSAAGKDSEALLQLMRATQMLNRLADSQPDSAVLRSELAACYLSSATILEGIGNAGDAREVRSMAMEVLRKMLEQSPDDVEIKLALAGCMGAMAEACVLSGDITGAESLSREAMTHLESVLQSQPDNTDAVGRRAALLSIRAGILRDRGFSQEAMEDYEEGIRALERLKASARGRALVSYRLALLQWQKGRMLGMDGKRDKEIELLGNARALLAGIEEGKDMEELRMEQIQRSTVYLLGDLGHAWQMDGDKGKALQVFREALELWDFLSRLQPHNEEYSEGVVWCRQRVHELEQAGQENENR